MKKINSIIASMLLVLPLCLLTTPVSAQIAEDNLPPKTIKELEKNDKALANFAMALFDHPEKNEQKCGEGEKNMQLFFDKLTHYFSHGSQLSLRDDEGSNLDQMCLHYFWGALSRGEINKKDYEKYLKRYNNDSVLIRLVDYQSIVDEIDLNHKKPTGNNFTGFSGRNYTFTLESLKAAKSPLESYLLIRVARALNQGVPVTDYYQDQYTFDALIFQEYYDVHLKENNGFNIDAFYKALDKGMEAGTSNIHRATLYYEGLKKYTKKSATLLRNAPQFNQNLFDQGAVNYIKLFPGETSTINAIQNACDYKSKPLYHALLEKAKQDKMLANLMQSPRYENCKELK